MPVVVDSSVVLAWVLPDETSAAADRMLDQLSGSSDVIVVPRLWVQETANAIVTAVRRGRLTDAQAQRCVELLAGLPVEFEPHPADQRSLVATALRYGLSASHATYLLLAERTGSALASFDDRLTQAALAAGVPLLR